MVCIRTRHKTPASFFILVFWVKAEEVRHQSHSSIFRLFSARISRWPPKKLYLSWSATFFRFSAVVEVRQAFFFCLSNSQCLRVCVGAVRLGWSAKMTNRERSIVRWSRIVVFPLLCKVVGFHKGLLRSVEANSS